MSGAKYRSFLPIMLVTFLRSHLVWLTTLHCFPHCFPPDPLQEHLALCSVPASPSSHFEQSGDDLLYRSDPPLLPGPGTCLLAELLARICHCLVIVGAFDRIHGNHEDLTKCRCCPPQLDCFERPGLCYQQHSHHFQAGRNERLDPYCDLDPQALLTTAMCLDQVLLRHGCTR